MKTLLKKKKKKKKDDDDDSITGKNKIKNIITTESLDYDKEVSNKEYEGGMDMMSCLSREISEHQEQQENFTEHYEHLVSDANTEEDVLCVVDPDLWRRTESNRHIPLDELEELQQHIKLRSKTIHGQSESVHKDLLVFADTQTVLVSTANRLVVAQVYGAGKSGLMPDAYIKKNRKQKVYLVACDFSKESLYAIEWTMGTMMRDGDELHVATVASREDSPEAIKATGLDHAGELRTSSDALITEAKKLLGQMMLFNIKLVTHAMVGCVKDILYALTQEYDYTMLVCGSRGRSSVKSLLMGSVSTYLVHKSLVPVTVIRRQKKKRRLRRQSLKAHASIEGNKTGQLPVGDESKAR